MQPACYNIQNFQCLQPCVFHTNFAIEKEEGGIFEFKFYFAKLFYKMGKDDDMIT